LLRSKGRGKDTVLAHITPKEAALLKKRGGRGSRNPDTGLLEFEDSAEYDFSAPAPASPVYDVIQPSGDFSPTMTGADMTTNAAGQEIPVNIQAGLNYNPADVSQYDPAQVTQGDPYANVGGGTTSPYVNPYIDPTQFTAPQVAAPRSFAAQLPAGYDPSTAGLSPQEMALGSSRAGTFIPSAAAPDITTGTGDSTYTEDEVRALQKQLFGDQQTQEQAAKEAAKKETDYAKWIETLGRLGLGAATIAGLSRYVQQPTQATAANQVANAAGKIANIGAPYKAIGNQLMGQAQTGGLSPGDVQAVNAARAQGSQDISRRGGVGTLQYANSIADLTARLMDNQFKLGLATSAIGDQYALQAITTQLAGDQQINQANTNFYTQLANMFAPFILGASRPTTATAAAPSTIGAIGP
jgi:hypothetical protein